MKCSGYQSAHTHNTPSSSLTGGIYRERAQRRGALQHVCVCTRDTQWSCSDLLHRRHRLWQEKNRAEVGWERNSKEEKLRSVRHFSPSYPLSWKKQIHFSSSKKNLNFSHEATTFILFWQSEGLSTEISSTVHGDHCQTSTIKYESLLVVQNEHKELQSIKEFFFF